MSIYVIAQRSPFGGSAFSFAVGDIDSAGTKVVEYKYDAWGKPLSKTGTLASTLGTLQPFRYRHYAYDEETGMYYLGERYYLPSLCRMRNADCLLESNLYAYCKNSPIRRVDSNGCKDYSTIGPGVDLFDLVYNQDVILGDVEDYLAEQRRIINAQIRYSWGSQSDNAGYCCATFISMPLQKISKTKANKGRFIRSGTGIGVMLRNREKHLLFIARLGDYALDEIPVGASFLRTAGYNGEKAGHGATFAARLTNGMLTINHASCEGIGIISENISYGELCSRFEYVAWPVGLGTREESPNYWRVIDDPFECYE